MTYILETESHGEVESGFYSIFSQFARLGKLTFATRHLCELVQLLATNPDVHEAKILSYDLDKFWGRQREHMQGMGKLLLKATSSYCHSPKKSMAERQLGSGQGEVCAEDDVDLHNEGTSIHVTVPGDERSIMIGEYEIAALHFGRLSGYLANGGIVGWLNGKAPAYAQPTIEAIRGSTRELYQEIRNELEASFHEED